MNTVITVHAANNNTESQDWVAMLLRMYGIFSHHHKFNTNLYQNKLKVYGMEPKGLQAEWGVHRLVRTSPYDPEHRRTTSFAFVEVSPSTTGQCWQAKEFSPVPHNWDDLIRSYILHPYTLVKDNRTGIETSDVESVLDGNIDLFLDINLSLTEAMVV